MPATVDAVPIMVALVMISQRREVARLRDVVRCASQPECNYAPKSWKNGFRMHKSDVI